MTTPFDGSRTPKISKAEWPLPLRSVIEACVASPLPILCLSVPDARMASNAAFDLLASGFDEAAPEAFAREAWPGAAAVFQPIIDAVVRGESIVRTGQPLGPSRRHGGNTRLFDLACSPVFDDRGSVVGALCIVAETERSRPALLLRVADAFRVAGRRDEVIAIALKAIAQEMHALSVGHAEVDLVHDDATFDDEGSDGFVRHTGHMSVEEMVPGEVEALHRGESVVVEVEGPVPASRLVVPQIRETRLRSVFVATRRREDGWSPADRALVSDIAGRAWEAVERVLSAATLRRNQARQGFLLVLGDRLRELEDPGEIMETTAESLGRHLKVSRAGYGEISGRSDILFSTGWSEGGVPPLVGRFDLADFGQTHVDELARGLTATLTPAESEPAKQAMTIGLCSLMAVPLIRDGTLRGALLLGNQQERLWSADDVALVGEVAARLWEALERARAEAALHDLNVTLENRVAQRTQELTTSEARFRTLFANAPAPIFLIRVGLEGSALFDAVNAAAERFLGRPAATIVGRPVTQRTSTGASLLDQCLRSAETGQPIEFQITIEIEGSLRTAECVLAPLPIEDNETQLLIGIARDITAQRQAEEQLRQAQKMEAIGQLTGGIAHDFNNLLTGIIGSLALMEKRIAQGKTEALTRYLGLAMTSANRAAALTHRLLAFSRRQPLEAKPVDVGALVVSMDDLLRRTLGEDVVLDLVQPAEPWLTLCDAHQLENALLNLAINARDAMPDGGKLTLETANTSLTARQAARASGVAAGDYVVLAVTDTGIGMTPDVIARAFDPFFTTKPIGQGTGLGLSMIYGFAKQSDGNVKIDSEVGRGTTVRIFLPRYRGHSETPSEEAAGAIPRAEAGETVLVVEDDPTVRDLVLEVLQDLGYLAIEAVDGVEGLKVIHSNIRIDLLVTDVGLPGMNGRQLAEQARAHRPDLNVLFITGYAENAAFGAGHLESGMQMMTKPFAVDDLATRIRSILQAATPQGSADHNGR